jgi:RNA-binding protein Musashi
MMLDQGKIFVGGLSWQTNEESLRWHFEQYGKVVSVEVMRDRVTGDPRGFAFVVFAEAATVDLVMNEPNHEINHKIVDVKRAQARGVAPPSIHKDELPDPAKGGADRGGAAASTLTPEQQGNKVFVGGTLDHPLDYTGTTWYCTCLTLSLSLCLSLSLLLRRDSSQY